MKNKKDEECFKWVMLVALHSESIDLHLERISDLRRFQGSYDWRGLTFPLPLNKIKVLAMGGEKLYILRKSKFGDQRKMANLLLIAQEGKKQYAMIKNLSQLPVSSNSEHQHKQYFCLNSLQGFQSKTSMNKHFEYCADNEAVRIDMLKRIPS